MFNAKSPGWAVRSYIVIITAAIFILAVLCAVLLLTAGEAKADTAAEAEYTIEKDESGRRMITSYSSGNTQTRLRIPVDVDGISEGAFKAASTAYIAGAEKKIGVKTYLAKPKLSAMAKSGKTKLSWKKVPAASQVQVYVKYPGKKKYEKVLTRSAKLRSVTHKGMKKGRVYRYKVRMRTKTGGRYVYSKYSNVVKVRAR